MRKVSFFCCDTKTQNIQKLKISTDFGQQCHHPPTFSQKKKKMGIFTGGWLLSPKWYMDTPAVPRESDLLYTNFLPNFPPNNIPFSKEKHPILVKLGAFYSILPKIHPIYVIWDPSSQIQPPIAIPNFGKKCPKRQAHIRIPASQCENPPGIFIPLVLAWVMTACFVSHSRLTYIWRNVNISSIFYFFFKISFNI